MGKQIAALLYWLLPAYLLFQSGYQIQVLRGLELTHASGQAYEAQVLDFRIKNMQAQSNGIVHLTFNTADGQAIERRMSLPVQIAAQARQYGTLSIHYLESSPQQVVLMQVYDLHHNMVRINIAILITSLLVTIIIGIFVLRWAKRQREAEVVVFIRDDVPTANLSAD